MVEKLKIHSSFYAKFNELLPVRGSVVVWGEHTVVAAVTHPSVKSAWGRNLHNPTPLGRP